MPGPKPRSKQQVFDSLFQNTTQDKDCIIPKKKPMPAGYIQVLHQGVYDYAHRFVYEFLNGKLKPGLVVRHLCNNKACINPNHLTAGTHADNVQDKVAANRQPRGFAHYRANLSEQSVREIRADTTSSLAELSRRYGISRGGIKNIKEFKTWKHITGATQ